ncbi:hypothetical protein BJX65DRAFT_315368 [Aspergillus insuetus]
MDNSAFNELINWGDDGLTEFPDFDWALFDSVFSFCPEQPIEEVPDLIPDIQPVEQDAISSLCGQVEELSTRVATLETQLNSESRKRQALERYIEDLQPFLVCLSSMMRN